MYVACLTWIATFTIYIVATTGIRSPSLYDFQKNKRTDGKARYVGGIRVKPKDLLPGLYRIAAYTCCSLSYGGITR